MPFSLACGPLSFMPMGPCLLCLRALLFLLLIYIAIMSPYLVSRIIARHFGSSPKVSSLDIFSYTFFIHYLFVFLFIHLFIHSFIHLFVYSFIQQFIAFIQKSFNCHFKLTNSIIHPLNCPPYIFPYIKSFTDLFIHSFIHSFVLSSIHSRTITGKSKTNRPPNISEKEFR